MKIHHNLLLTSMTLMAATNLFPAKADPIPVDPEVKIGQLDNGLTYYIRHNNWPENRADFFIAQKVGSINEEENQRGLAHFLEHMCFNGTKHFPGNSIITYMESIGVKFGANLNAYTSTDETVYNISNVPVSRASALDSCLLVLRDWSHDLTLDSKEIDKERGVIEGEWRYRSGANYRMMDKCVETLYPGNLYGRRMPIGLLSVIRNFKPKQLRDYYHKWYHPANQAIIIVGDIDPVDMENKVKQMFSSIPAKKNAAPIIPCKVADNEEIICTVQSDKEQSTANVQLFFKHDDLNEAVAGSITALRNDYVKDLAVSMLVERFDEIEKEPDAPFTHAGIGDGKFLISKTRQAFIMRAVSKPGREADCIRRFGLEARRAATFGFTAPELDLAKESYAEKLEKLYQNRTKYGNTAYARDYVRNFIDNEPIPSIDDFHRIVRGFENEITLDEVNDYIRKVISPTDTNVVIVAFCPQKAGYAIPSEQSLIAAFHQSGKDQIAPYRAPEIMELRLDKEPSAGKIVEIDSIASFGAEIWKLSNGIKVYVKQTDYAPDEVTVNASSPGGFSQYAMENVPSMKMANDVMAASGYGKFSSSQLKRALTGKRVSITPFIANMEEGISGRSSTKDLETAFQLLYLKVTAPKRDDKAFNALIEANRVRLENQNSNPRMVMGDSIFANVYSHHPLARKISADSLPKVNYDRILDMYRDRFSDMGDFTFYIVGNFDKSTLKNLVEKYIASLPSKGRIERSRDIGYRLAKGKVDVKFSRPMENPQSVVYYFWNNACDYNLKNNVVSNVLGQILSTSFLREIREERGWTYSLRTHCSVTPEINGNDGPQMLMPVYCPVKPGNEDACAEIIVATVDSVASNGVNPADLNKAKRFMEKQVIDNEKENGYWQAILKTYAKYGKDFHSDYLDTVKQITSDDIRDFVKDYIVTGNRCRITMYPDATSLQRAAQ